MTKEELVETVNLIHAMWNKEPPTDPDRLKTLYRAWSRLLLNCPQEGILTAAETLAHHEQYLPPPGMIRAEYERTQPGAAPTPAQAWNQYVALRDAVNTGTHNPTTTTIHPRLQKTITQVGYSLSTNDDRRHFTATYQTTDNNK